MFNFIKRLRDYKARRDNADMTIRNWKVKNKDIYADFTRRIDAIANGEKSADPLFTHCLRKDMKKGVKILS